MDSSSPNHQLSLLRSIRKVMPPPQRAIPDRKRQAVRKRVKHLRLHNLNLP